MLKRTAIGVFCIPAKRKTWGQRALGRNSVGDSDTWWFVVSTTNHKGMPPVLLKVEIPKQGLLNANTTNEKYRKGRTPCLKER